MEEQGITLISWAPHPGVLKTRLEQDEAVWMQEASETDT